MTTVAQILDEAKEYMHKHGFCKNALDDYQGHVCTMGAIYNGFDNIKRRDGAVFNQHLKSAMRYTSSVLDDKGLKDNIAQWNDKPETTQADAEWLLEIAADKARIEGK